MLAWAGSAPGPVRAPSAAASSTSAPAAASAAHSAAAAAGPGAGRPGCVKVERVGVGPSGVIDRQEGPAGKPDSPKKEGV